MTKQQRQIVETIARWESAASKLKETMECGKHMQFESAKMIHRNVIATLTTKAMKAKKKLDVHQLNYLATLESFGYRG
jgi:hypothetical protein